MAWTNRGRVCLVLWIFYGVQAILVGISALIIFNDVGPTIAALYFNTQDDTNIVSGNPGLSLRPIPDEESGEPSFLISYKGTDRNAYRPWVDSLDKFLKAYKQPWSTTPRVNLYNCDYRQPPPPGAVCDVEVKNLAECITENLFSYHKSAPCIFLRLNTPIGWTPVFYNNTDSLPNSMPNDLKAYIAELKIEAPHKLNTIWVSCEGENPADIEFVGPIYYHPLRGFPGYYFPNNNIKGYMPPLVAVHFKKPFIGPIINIKCKAWARNIKHDNDSALGGVQFGLMLE